MKIMMFYDGTAYIGTEEDMLAILTPHRGEEKPVVIDYTETTTWCHTVESAARILEQKIAVDVAERAVEEVLS